LCCCIQDAFGQAAHREEKLDADPSKTALSHPTRCVHCAGLHNCHLCTNVTTSVLGGTTLLLACCRAFSTRERNIMSLQAFEAAKNLIQSDPATQAKLQRIEDAQRRVLDLQVSAAGHRARFLACVRDDLPGFHDLKACCCPDHCRLRNQRSRRRSMHQTAAATRAKPTRCTHCHVAALSISRA